MKRILNVLLISLMLVSVVGFNIFAEVEESIKTEEKVDAKKDEKKENDIFEAVGTDSEDEVEWDEKTAYVEIVDAIACYKLNKGEREKNPHDVKHFDVELEILSVNGNCFNKAGFSIVKEEQKVAEEKEALPKQEEKKKEENKNLGKLAIDSSVKPGKYVVYIKATVTSEQHVMEGDGVVYFKETIVLNKKNVDLKYFGKEVTYPTLVKDFTYNGKNNSLINNDGKLPEKLSFVYCVKEVAEEKLTKPKQDSKIEVECKDIKAEAKDAGKYTVYADIVSDYYDVKDALKQLEDKEVNILKADPLLKAPVANVGLQYCAKDAKGVELVSAGTVKAESNKIQYRVDKGEWSYDVPTTKGLSVGKHTVSYKVESNKNYNEVKEAEIKVEIAIADNNKIANDNGVIYDAEHTKGENDAVVIICSADAEDLQKVLVDGKEVKITDVTIKAGSTIATFANAYLETLSIGVHNVVFEYKNFKNFEATLTIKEKTVVVNPTPVVEKKIVNTACK